MTRTARRVNEVYKLIFQKRKTINIRVQVILYHRKGLHSFNLTRKNLSEICRKSIYGNINQ